MEHLFVLIGMHNSKNCLMYINIRNVTYKKVGVIMSVRTTIKLLCLCWSCLVCISCINPTGGQENGDQNGAEITSEAVLNIDSTVQIYVENLPFRYFWTVSNYGVLVDTLWNKVWLDTMKSIGNSNYKVAVFNEKGEMVQEKSMTLQIAPDVPEIGLLYPNSSTKIVFGSDQKIVWDTRSFSTDQIQIRLKYTERYGGGSTDWSTTFLVENSGSCNLPITSDYFEHSNYYDFEKWLYRVKFYLFPKGEKIDGGKTYSTEQLTIYSPDYSKFLESPLYRDTCYVYSGVKLKWDKEFFNTDNIVFSLRDKNLAMNIDSVITNNSGEEFWIVPDVDEGYYHLKCDYVDEENNGKTVISYPFYISKSGDKIENPIDTFAPVLPRFNDTTIISGVKYTKKLFLLEYEESVTYELLKAPNNVKLSGENLSWEVTDFESGENEISIVAIDKANNKDTTTWSITVKEFLNIQKGEKFTFDCHFSGFIGHSWEGNYEYDWSAKIIRKITIDSLYNKDNNIILKTTCIDSGLQVENSKLSDTVVTPVDTSYEREYLCNASTSDFAIQPTAYLFQASSEKTPNSITYNDGTFLNNGTRIFNKDMNFWISEDIVPLSGGKTTYGDSVLTIEGLGTIYRSYVEGESYYEYDIVSYTMKLIEKNGKSVNSDSLKAIIW